MVSVQAVCNSILKRAFEQGVAVSPMKLQKILYFVYRDVYQNTKTKLFDEPFQTWKYGPVVRSVYDEFQAFGCNPIRCFIKDACNRVQIIDERKLPAVAASMDFVWECCKQKDGIALSHLTYTEGSAWWNAYQKDSPILLDEDIFYDRTDITGNRPVRA